MSHLYASAFNVAGDHHPAPTATLTANRAFCTATAGDNTFPADESEDAVIVAILATAVSAGSADVTLRNRAGDEIFQMRVTPNSPMFVAPCEGLRVEGGFYFQTSAATLFVTVVYDKVAG